MEYYIKQVGDNAYSVSKFERGDAPLDSYTVQIGAIAARSSCNCMAWITKKRRPCKHIEMVSEFLSAGSPEMFSIVR